MTDPEPQERTLAGQVVVVTGSGRGIGRALAVYLAGCGARVVVTSRTRSDLDAVVEQVRDAGGVAHAVVADATSKDGARAPVTEALRVFGGVDAVVNNVGGRIFTDHNPYTCDDDVLLDHLMLNVVSGWWTTRAALGPMRDRGRGRIVFIGSGSATRAGAPISYTTAKHGLVGLTKSLALAVAPDGITVNCVSPGWTNTEHNDFERIAERWGTTAARARAIAESENAQHRILEPEEIGPMVELLVAERGAAITGQVIHVDGGYRL